ncbi:MAG: carbamoyl-phosphate synthase large subunit, partial [Verrucomicrobiota bacterium]|nr:carbamoyl-phosphate synthase large subunit [Verrucomicrobiota bacterium]
SQPASTGEAPAGRPPTAGAAVPLTPARAAFRAFDQFDDVTIRRRSLPHWRQEGATYAVTFRLADSLPTSLLEQWEEELRIWLSYHPQPWDDGTEREYTERFSERRDEWLDQGHGSCLLRDRRAREVLVETLKKFEGERYVLDAFVVMPNHVHAILQPAPGHQLSKILHSWKSYTAKAINQLFNRIGSLWMDESYDRIVRDFAELQQQREYIRQNPEKARLREGEFALEVREALWPRLPAREEGVETGGAPATRPPTAGAAVPRPALLRAKKMGFSDRQLAVACGVTDRDIRALRRGHGVIPTYRLVDTCAAEFEAYTPYYYSTYGDESERRDSGKKKVIILGGGPNRIGQGIEFDYCCVHAVFALKEEGFETIMVNSNPETVSTDYDTSDKLYFEPLTLEDVLNICEQESENLFGVIVQFGGQTPLNLAAGLQEAGVPIIGTSPQSIEIAEDRKLFSAMLEKLGIRQTAGGTATDEDEAVQVADHIGYPVLVRPSFVLGGRGMELVHNETDLRRYVRNAVDASQSGQSSASFQLANQQRQAGSSPHFAERPILIDRFLEDAAEVDVDCISDGDTVVIGAIMEHIEEAGIHSGDSSCVIPPFSLSEKVKTEIAAATKAMAKELHVRGLMNVQFAIKDDVVYVLEVNPRASRTVPFVSKAIGVPLAKLAARVMAGRTLKELGFTAEITPSHYSVKEAVFPFIRFPGIDIVLGPEMKSTGEVMGIDASLGLAYAKAQMAASPPLPTRGNIFISVADRQKSKVAEIARGFVELGFTIYATSGTAAALKAAKVPVVKLFKLTEGRPNALDMIKNGELAFIINTPSGKTAREDEIKIRSTATANRIPITTTLRAAKASLEGIRALRESGLRVKPLQAYHRGRITDDGGS